MKWPLAYFITWTTYGTWLHGDESGSFDAAGDFIPPDPALRAAMQAMLVECPVTLTLRQRSIVDSVIVDHCRHREWILHARNVRTQHVHVVVSAAREGTIVREQLKAWGSRRLSEAAGLGRGTAKDGARKWWTEKGNILPVTSDKGLVGVTKYALEDQ